VCWEPRNPTVTERRIIQQLSLQFDSLFSEHSYGFRPQRSAHDAVKAAQQYVQEGKAWVIDIDLKAFFDNVNHDKLIYLIREQVKDTRISTWTHWIKSWKNVV